jgi:hypothetical protein
MATPMASAVLYLKTIRWPIALAALNSLLAAVIFDWPWGDVAYNLARLVILLYAAWVLVRAGITSLWVSAFTGLLLFFIDHPVVRGGHFLIADEPMGFYGVLISFVMFAAIPMVVTAVAAYTLRKRAHSVAI